MKLNLENFAVRLIASVALCIVGTLLGGFIRATVIVHEPFVLDAVKHFVFPAFTGVLVAFIWHPKSR